MTIQGDWIGAITTIILVFIGAIIWLVRLEGKISMLNLCKDENRKNIQKLYELKKDSEDELKKEFKLLQDDITKIELLLMKIITKLDLNDNNFKGLPNDH